LFISCLPDLVLLPLFTNDVEEEFCELRELRILGSRLVARAARITAERLGGIGYGIPWEAIKAA
jgi:hypothetical protein